MSKKSLKPLKQLLALGLVLILLSLMTIGFSSAETLKSLAVKSVTKSGLPPVPQVSVDNQAVLFADKDLQPFTDSKQVVYVPLQFFSKSMGLAIEWDAKKQEARVDHIVSVKSGEARLTTTLGPVVLSGPVVSKKNRLFVPIEPVAQALGYKSKVVQVKGVWSVAIRTQAKLTLSAASSLRDALTDLQALYLKNRPKQTLALNFGASGALGRQIEQGASVDVFFSAAEAPMKALDNQGLLLEGTMKPLLGNDLVLIAPLGTTLRPGTFKAVTDASIKHLALGEPKSVPAGQYAEAVFTKLGILEEARAKAVYGKDVREVLTWVESGNADAGVVYATDAKTSKRIKVLATASEASHQLIIYPIAAIKHSKEPEAARAWIAFLASDTARDVFKKYGFSLVE